MAMPGKLPRKRVPNQLAVIDQHGCTGCEACLVVCPVDCIELAPSDVNRDFMKVVEIDYERCIGCALCAKICPWDTIEMLGYQEGLKLAPEMTIRSIVPGQTSGSQE